jgi:hypothetical protein
MMKRLGVLALLLLVTVMASGQVVIREQIRVRDTLFIDKYEVRSDMGSVAQLKMNPGDYRLLKPSAVDVLRGTGVFHVDLVYSDFPEGEDFSELNRHRFIELFNHAPFLFNNSMISWRIVVQKGVARTGNLASYFHGFVVYYRPMPSYSSEAEYISQALNGGPLKDSSVIQILNRNAHWKDMLVVADVTGSMSPYTAQLLVWLKVNQKLGTFKQIVFFNDDDEASTDQRSVEDSFGMWAVETKSFDKVWQTALEAMHKGSHYENNLEAVCYAIKKFPLNKHNVVMIADNWENPCDMKLLKFLKEQKIPIRIVVCGVQDKLNPIYLDIAYATGGSVHTMEDDLVDLAKLGEGKVFKIGSLKFKMKDGKFVQISCNK